MVWPIIRGESYVGETGKSMKGVELARSREIVVVISPLRSKPQLTGEQTAQACANAWLHQLSHPALIKPVFVQPDYCRFARDPGANSELCECLPLTLPSGTAYDPGNG